MKNKEKFIYLKFPCLEYPLYRNLQTRYEIDEIGPIYLAWAKRRIKNDKGRIVKEWYIKSDKKHLIWVKWTEPFKVVKCVFE